MGFSQLFNAEMAEGEVQAVLIDCSSVIFVDVAGARLFIQVSVNHTGFVLTSVGILMNNVICSRYLYPVTDVHGVPEDWGNNIPG